MNEIVISDFTRIVEQQHISAESTKGKWWSRSYKTPDGKIGQMLCAEQRDMDDPESCLVAPITLPLDLSGYYQIWIGTYRPRFGGGLDVKLSDEDHFRFLDPQQVDMQDPANDHSGKLVEMLFHEGVDLTGKDLVFQQPYGTYQSLYWGDCKAHLAYVKLIPLGEDDIARQKERQGRPKLPYGYDMDGFSHFWLWGTEDPQCVERLIEPLRYSDASFWSFCVGNVGGFGWVPEMPGDIVDPLRFSPEMGGGRLGDHRFVRISKAFEKQYGSMSGAVRALIERSHEIGVEMYLSVRMSQGAGRGPLFKQHPEWKLPRREDGVMWNFAIAEVRKIVHDEICWLAENFDSDGISLDFSRLAEYFELEEKNKFEFMNDFVRSVRQSFDRINLAKKAAGKPEVKLIATWVENTGYLKRMWDCGHFFHEQGLDVRTWLEEGWFDIIMPEGPGVERYTAIARDDICYPPRPSKPSSTKVYLRKEPHFKFGAADANMVECDPSSEEDKKDILRYGKLGPLEVSKGMIHWMKSKPDGIFMFNFDITSTNLNRLGDVDDMKQRVSDNCPFAMIDRDRIEFLS